MSRDLSKMGPMGGDPGSLDTIMSRQWLAAAALALIGWLAAPPAMGAGNALPCHIEPNVIVTVSAPAEGVVNTIQVDRGTLVKEGQVLATLESSVEEAAVRVARHRAEMQAMLKSSETRFQFAQRKLARAEDLSAKHTISMHELDEAQTELLLAELGRLEAREKRREAELELQRATAALNLRTIRSPVGGIVVERLASVGEYVNNLRSQVVKLAQISPLRVEVFVPVSLLGTIRLGQQAEVTPAAPMNQPHLATVSAVDQVIDTASGTFGVRLKMPNPEHRLPAGLSCSIRFLPGPAASDHREAQPAVP